MRCAAELLAERAEQAVGRLVAGNLRGPGATDAP